MPCDVLGRHRIAVGDRVTAQSEGGLSRPATSPDVAIQATWPVCVNRVNPRKSGPRSQSRSTRQSRCDTPGPRQAAATR
jgi:hypothetical protein